MLDAAALAAILDPERTVPGWWKAAPIKCGNGSRDGVHDIYTGPPDLHTAREHCWRMEEWLEARGFNIRRIVRNDLIRYTEINRELSDVYIKHNNHAAALNAAIERISNEKSS